MSSPPHGKVCGVFDDLSLFLVVLVYVSLSLVARCALYIRSTVRKYSNMRSFILFIVLSCLSHVPIIAITLEETTSNPKIS